MENCCNCASNNARNQPRNQQTLEHVAGLLMTGESVGVTGVVRRIVYHVGTCKADAQQKKYTQ